jgi:hypothetical protein
MTKLDDLMTYSKFSPYSTIHEDITRSPDRFVSQFANEKYIVKTPKGVELKVFNDLVDVLPYLKRQEHGTKVYRQSDNKVLAFASSFKMTASERKEYK